MELEFTRGLGARQELSECADRAFLGRTGPARFRRQLSVRRRRSAWWSAPRRTCQKRSVVAQVKPPTFWPTSTA